MLRELDMNEMEMVSGGECENHVEPDGSNNYVCTFTTEQFTQGDSISGGGSTTGGSTTTGFTVPPSAFASFGQGSSNGQIQITVGGSGATFTGTFDANTGEVMVEGDLTIFSSGDTTVSLTMRSEDLLGGTERNDEGRLVFTTKF